MTIVIVTWLARARFVNGVAPIGGRSGSSNIAGGKSGKNDRFFLGKFVAKKDYHRHGTRFVSSADREKKRSRLSWLNAKRTKIVFRPQEVRVVSYVKRTAQSRYRLLLTHTAKLWCTLQSARIIIATSGERWRRAQNTASNVGRGQGFFSHAKFEVFG